jgi:2-polyprenyl-3-methyl-5-hydroxy-6-metoxy-1,4-benzoquinol methylase
MRIIKNTAELDQMIAECERAALVSDDDLRRVFGTFRMDVSEQLPPDPFSTDYAYAQLALYEQIAGRAYETGNEKMNLNVREAAVRPFPYTASCEIAGGHISALGFLLSTMRLSAGARVLDVGAGWGNTTLLLALLGFKVTALDINGAFCELVSERARRASLQVEVVNDDFFWIERSARSFDAILFFESFHHCADHLRLLRALGPALSPDGHIYFGAESIYPDFPVPWGIRTDGQSLWAIRRNGWLELGFRPDYFHDALRRAGLSAQVHTFTDLPWLTIWDAKVGASNKIQIAAPNSTLAAQTDVQSQSGELEIALSNRDAEASKIQRLRDVKSVKGAQQKTPQTEQGQSPDLREVFQAPQARMDQLLGHTQQVKVQAPVLTLVQTVQRVFRRLHKIGDRLTGGGLRSLMKRVATISLRRAMRWPRLRAIGRRLLKPFPAFSARIYNLATVEGSCTLQTPLVTQVRDYLEIRPPDTKETADESALIVDVYRGLLGRDPDEDGLRHFSYMLRDGGLDRVGLIKAIRSSKEFNNSVSGEPPRRNPDPFGCRRSEAEALFFKFDKHDGPGRPGFVTNFLGGLTDVRFAPGIDLLSCAVEGYPIPGNFHGETLEWVGTLRSVLDARRTFTMLELGAGWAPWCVIGYLAAKQRGIEKIKVLAVEGDDGHVGFIRETFAANGIGPDIGQAIHGVVGIVDGHALFPKANDPSRVYGGAAAFSEAEKATGAFAEFTAAHSALVQEVQQLPCYSLATLMHDFDLIDLIHCDIQGAEAALFANVIELVSSKVKRVVVGTHSFEIDRQLACLFPKNDWVLEGINACEMREDDGRPATVRDGMQVWRNTRF